MESNKPRFVNLVSDTTFKYMWKNPRTRQWFVDIIMNKTGMDLSDYEFVDNESNTGSSVKDQRNDLVLSDFRDNIVIIEMNSSYSDSLERKYRYYLYRRAGNNYLVGDDYTEEKHITLIAFNNYVREDIGDAKVLNSWFGVHDLGIKYDDIEMYEIYLPNFYEMCYHKSNKIEKRLWMFGAKSYDEMRNLVSNKDDLYIVEELERLSMNNEFIDEYDYEIVKNKLIKSFKIEGHELGRAEGRAEGIIEGRAEGRAQGRAQGRAEGEKSKQIEIARIMLSKDSDINFVSECTGLCIEEIKGLK